MSSDKWPRHESYSYCLLLLTLEDNIAMYGDNLIKYYYHIIMVIKVILIIICSTKRAGIW